MLRDYFLIARPPLLAVMQGGDYRARFQIIHTFYDRRLFQLRLHRIRQDFSAIDKRGLPEQSSRLSIP